MTDDDALFRFRLRLFGLAEELGNVRAACRAWASIPRPSTAGGRRSSASAPRSCGPASAVCRACPTPSRSGSSSASSPSPSATPASAPGASRPSWRGPCGAALRSRRTASGACCGATASRRAPAASGWWPAMPPRPRRSPASPSPSATSTSPTPASSCSSTASASAGSRAPRAPSGSTRRSTSPPPSPGPSCTLGAQPAGRARLGAGAPRGRRAGAAGWRLERVLTDNGSEFRSGDFAERRRAGGGAQLHQRRPAAVERLRRARPAHHPRGVLEARLRPLPGAQVHGPAARPRLPRLYNFDRAHTALTAAAARPSYG